MSVHTFFINTATKHTAIALYSDDKLLAEQHWPAEHNEAEKLQPAVAQLLQDQGLEVAAIDRLVACVGPGGFTSTRVGVSAANAWSFAQGIPLAQVSVFELYPDDRLVFLSANPQEIWLREPGKDPQFFQADDVSLADSFVFTGVVSDSWKELLEQGGGIWEECPETLPPLSTLSFPLQSAQPWYYKEPHITWSRKNAPQ